MPINNFLYANYCIIIIDLTSPFVNVSIRIIVLILNNSLVIDLIAQFNYLDLYKVNGYYNLLVKLLLFNILCNCMHAASYIILQASHYF